MMDDFAGGKKPARPPKKITRIEPLEKPAKTPLHELAAAEEPDFVVADQGDDIETVSIGDHTADADKKDSAKSKEPKQKRSFKFPLPHTKKQKIITAVVATVLVIGGGASALLLTHHKAAPVAVVKRKVVKKVPPVPIYSTLSGLQISDASLNKKTVTGVMIENSTDARPQSGLSQAGVVFEAVAEGGVTRFLALYQDQAPTNVGPVRSARPYYVQWLLGYDGAYAHVGGSEDALSDISNWGVHDLNQFYNGDSYHRTTDRDAPHNVYTGIPTLNQLEISKGYSTSTYTGFLRKPDAPSKSVNAVSIDFGLSGPTYDPHYDYDAKTNSYNRSEAGVPQTDANTGAQLSPKVVIAIAVPLSRGALDASGAYYSDYNVLGTGQAWIFQDGVELDANWIKTTNTDSLTFTDTNGQPLSLNRGQAWITAVTDASKVIYK